MARPMSHIHSSAGLFPGPVGGCVIAVGIRFWVRDERVPMGVTLDVGVGETKRTVGVDVEVGRRVELVAKTVRVAEASRMVEVGMVAVAAEVGRDGVVGVR
jgi:hypothetical protein